MNRNFDNNKLKLAVLSMIPDSHSFYIFNEDISNEIRKKFIAFLFEQNVISEGSENELYTFIEKNALHTKGYSFSNEISFKDVIKKIEVHSFRQLADHVNKLAKDMDLDIQVSNTMFSRLTNEPVNTPKKRNTLRLLALWIGYRRSHLISNWNYETLNKLCNMNTINENSNGVRIAFSLHSRGDVINEKTIRWFKNELIKIIKDLKIDYASFDGADSFQVNEFTIDLPLAQSSQIDECMPVDYDKTVRDGIAIAHQMAIRWPLSQHINQRKYMTIGMASGEFSKLNIHLKSLLHASLSEDAIIRVTEFTRLCIVTNEIRVNFCSKPVRKSIADGEMITFWWIKSLWCTIYWDFIPILLTEKMLPTKREAFISFKKSLCIPDQREQNIHIALSAIHRYPQNSLLIIEIAKICFFRKMFHVANMIITTLFASNPHHVVARSLRMQIFLNLALEQEHLSVSKIFFQHSINEGLYITKHCNIEDEEPWCEFGLVYLGLALRILTIKRKKEEGVEDSEYINYENFIKNLHKANECFQQGLTFSPTGFGIRSSFWLMYSNTLIALFESNKQLFTTDIPIRDVDNIFEKVGINHFKFIGWIDENFDMDFLKQRMNRSIRVYNNSVLLSSFIPNIKFAFATVVFDFSPILTVGQIKQVLDWLNESKISANDLKEHKLGIYSILNCLAQIQAPEEFIEVVTRMIDWINKTLEDDLTKADHHVIDKNKLQGNKLILLYLEDRVAPGILV
ncbi:hypothetical protein MHK_009463 [Candidatus Magnetomorum sp. HK-1]|nr:hypothetical protein MHK_009463 [Candidatus Magnetomorum sp. HK-1]